MAQKRDRRGLGIGAHQNVSPMARGTRTKSKKGKVRQQDRKRKQKGWAE